MSDDAPVSACGLVLVDDSSDIARLPVGDALVSYVLSCCDEKAFPMQVEPVMRRWFKYEMFTPARKENLDSTTDFFA